MVFNKYLMRHKTKKPKKPQIAPLFRADLLDAIRDVRGFTREQLAERAGISRFGLFKIERGGDVRASTLKKIADALNVDMKIFFDFNLQLDVQAIKDGLTTESEIFVTSAIEKQVDAQAA
jgi:transcriptional regulator with XRE-family HTH domain